jgi:hypothetical protein
MSAPALPAEPRPGVTPAAVPDEPLLLWNRLVRARATVAQQRHLAITGPGMSGRGELLSALEAYVASLVSRGRPVPYTLRDELRLQRLTCSADRRQR